LEFALETPLPVSLEVGAGSALLLKGWCYHPDRALRKLEVLVDGKAFPVKRHSLTRFEILREREPDLLGSGNALNSGFAVVVPIHPSLGKTISLSLRAEFAGGVIETGELGSVDFIAEDVKGSAQSRDTSSVLGVSILLVASDPDEESLTRQIESLISQSYRDWKCDLSLPTDASVSQLLKSVEDDQRFTIHRHGEEPERSILAKLLNNATAEFIAIASPGDIWHADKLKECVAAFDSQTAMVYSDWESSEEDRHASEHKPGSTRLETALFGRMIPAGAIVFRKSLVAGLLPFPPETPNTTADEWISIAALALGNAKFIEKQLFLPAQPPAEIVFDPTSWLAGTKTNLAWMDELIIDRANPESAIARQATRVWIPERATFWSTILAQRNPAADKKPVLDRWTTLLDSPRFMLAEARKESGHAWTTHFALSSEKSLSAFTKRQRTDVLHALRSLWGLAGRAKGTMPNAGVDAARMHIDFIPKKIAPFNLDVSPDHPRRVNIVTSTIDFKYLFGGYFAVFSLALALDKAGYKVRLILTDPVDYKPNFWKHEIKKYHGLGDFFDRVEVLPNYERGPIESSPQDRFIATSWWTAFAAHSGAQQLGTPRFIYLSQDFEPYFYAASSFYALSLQSYSLPHYAIFSTEFLRIYSRAHSYGVFNEGTEIGDANSMSFQNAIKAPTPRRDRLERHGRKKRVLVYARPEDHANRNCFQLAALGLIGAIDAGHFPTEEWEFHGIGSVKVNGNMRLSGRADLRLLPKVSLEEYYAMLPDYDVGLSLMLTPHPSLVPLDMAASGIVTVTNTFDIKTRELLQPISSNLVVVPPTIEGIRVGLIEAKSKVDDIDARMKGTKLNWARTWDQAFDAAFVQKLSGWLEAGK